MYININENKAHQQYPVYDYRLSRKTVKTPVDGISPLDFAALQMLQPL